MHSESIGILSARICYLASYYPYATAVAAVARPTALTVRTAADQPFQQHGISIATGPAVFDVARCVGVDIEELLAQAAAGLVRINLRSKR